MSAGLVSGDSGRGVTLTEAGRSLHALAREHLLALADFKQSCAKQAIPLTVAAGDSLIQWVLVPRLQRLLARLPGVNLRLLNLSTSEIASGLADGTLDLALMRDGAAPAKIQTAPLGTMAFSLFVPAKLMPGGGMKLTVKEVSRLPLATLEGDGQFRQELQRAAHRAKIALNLSLEVSSFPLAAQAVRRGCFAALLPELAKAEFAGSGVCEVKAEWLRPLSRGVLLAWNPRLARVRSAVAKAIPVFSEICRIEAVEITKAGKPFARLVPPTPGKASKLVKPDILARLKKTWGDRVFSAQEVATMRAAEWEGAEG